MSGISAKPALIRRFVRGLLRAGSARHDDAGGFVSGGASLSQVEILALSSQGLVRVAKGVCYPTGETANWLRRQLAAPGEFAGQHRDLHAGPEGSLQDLNGNPLERLARAAGGGFLAPHHIAAGTRVCQWGERAQLRQRVTMSYDPAQVGGRRHGGTRDITDMAAEARKALSRLFVDLPRDCAEVIIDVCVFEKGLQVIETERGWPRRSAKLVLRIGLDQLAQRLGLSAKAVGKPTARLETWLGEDFAPTRFE